MTHIKTVSVYRDICTRQNFDQVIRTPIRVAWLLTYPYHDTERMRAGLNIAITRLLEFVSRNVTNDSAPAFLKAVEILLNRVHGPVVQRIESKHAHLNLNKPIPHPTNEDATQRIEELKAKLLEAREVKETVEIKEESNNE